MDRQTSLGTNPSPWSSVVLRFGRFPVAATGVPGGEAIDCAVGLIEAIEGAQDAQAEMLNAIHADVELLRLQAFRSGKLHLHEAARVNPQCERRTTLFNEAASRFLDAEPMCSCLEEGAVNQLYLGLTFGLLNNRDDASYWLGTSAACGTAAARAFAEAAGNINVVKSKKAVAATALLRYPAGATYLLKKRKRKRKQEAHAAPHALGEFLPFVNTAVFCHNALGVEAPISTLELQQSGKTTWTLQDSS
jgi:hypothetical protein